MSSLTTLVGAILIIATLIDAFQTLFHPSGKGRLSRTLIYGVWKATHLVARRYPKALQIAGPLGFLVTLTTWTAMLTLGWAFIYWPHLPDAFSFDPGMDPSYNAGFDTALYFSIVSLTTVGYGDILPNANWIRIIAPVQALTGFGLLTASITWLLSIFPALSYRRAFADEILLLRNTESEMGISVTNLGSDTAQQILGKATSQLITIRGDLIKFPIAYYFHSRDEQAELSVIMPYLLELVEKTSDAECAPEVRMRAMMLRGAIEKFSTTVASRFLGLSPSTPTDEVMEAYARDQLQLSSVEDDKEP
ncbi:MAG: hypothetical protein AVDCRST_MAG37-2351 [uncultured Rubrobacteraceae bacterium]|uniref:Potassium channel domain-containing protein n=1 Tax=uncultured Rubrobacteraceae bacterium TaxID=349277 RepID=A0A6J4QZM8_9ACTN|nr:MAG: hypothetical protein AVDCRST_MAG37-2351 [uncultured Rubrobacteraceae bacterium]